ncbi:MAG: hypothetical protein M1813_009112 [Trichoglossum hirsutum]|nr:MAG: hypothetical protein M1813_009112 [Trichoglossum hirsutum]
MDGLSGAASVIAVVDISAKITSLCFQYLTAAKDAKNDIERLQRKVAKIGGILEKIKQLLDGQDKARLPTTSELSDSLKECFRELEELKAELEPGKTRKAMSRFGVRALKWPFTGKQVEKIVSGLERYEQAFTLALQVDQMDLMFDLGQKLDLAKLPIAEGASFDSHMEEHNARCLSNTRTELLYHIREWAKDKNGKPIFWLNGMAGTGKSTVARTVAQSFADQGQLGASFFFKKGEGERGHATRFFTTIARDLIDRVPRLISGITKALNSDPAIPQKALKDQFEKLILHPLSEIQRAPPPTLAHIVVIDALDECEPEKDVRAILQLLARTRDMKPMSLRVLVTSRPEFPIRLGFKQMSDGTYQDLIPHEVPKRSIEHDIRLFLEHELREIQEQRLPSLKWPRRDQIQALVELAVPLFIFAATVCRYIADQRDNPTKRLEVVLQYQSATQVSKLDRTYLPILSQLFDDEDEADRQRRIDEFRDIVGSIVVLESPLSISSLASLFQISKEDIRCRLDSLHSVLSIPDSEELPVRLLHLSFRDFLVDPQKKKGKSPFWVDKRETHDKLADKCLELLSSPEGLQQNMCKLLNPRTLRSEIDEQMIAMCLSPELQYACRYWAHHLEQSDRHIHGGDPIHLFLQKYFLYWLEAMSLIGEAYKCIHIIRRLQALAESDTIPIYIRTPLQVYSSALVFAPETSIIRKTFVDYIPGWVNMISKVENDWDSCRSVLEGHSELVNAVAFSPDSQLVASASYDNTVRLWETATGSCRSTLEGHSESVSAVAFSPDGHYLQTDRGQIPLSLSPSNISSFQDKDLSTLFIKDEWVVLKEQLLLWLPPEYRPRCTAVYRDVICLGHSSGHVTILKVYLENISLAVGLIAQERQARPTRRPTRRLTYRAVVEAMHGLWKIRRLLCPSTPAFVHLFLKDSRVFDTVNSSVVMMDPITTGVVGIALGLAPTFSVCLEYFQYFKSAQSFSVDLELLILKLDIEHERMIAWGEANGILKTADESRNPGLDLPSTNDLIKRGLSSIQSLFRDGKKLQEYYGLQPIDGNYLEATNPKFLSTSGLRSFRKSYSRISKATGSQNKLSILSKTRWAIYDKAKFTVLLSDIKGLVDGLYQILPVPNKVRDKIVFKAIRSLVPDFKRLRLVETASEDGYSTWSEAASLMAAASEAGTMEGRSVGQWVEELDLDDSQETESETTSDRRNYPSKGVTRLDLKGCVGSTLYFVFTPACSSDLLKEACDEATLGWLSLSRDGPHFQAKPTFGNRITKAINPVFSYDSLQILQQSNYEFPEIQKLALEASLPLARVDVFCAPCACAIQTAIRLCQAESSQLISYEVKVDDRVPVSCCANLSKIDRLNSLLITIQEYDAGLLNDQSHLNTQWIRFLDRVWIEQRIYELETTIYTGEDFKPGQWSIAELLKTLTSRYCVLLGEVDRCLWILQTEPFPWTPRMPKANEIYQARWQSGGWHREFLGSFTPRNFRSQAPSIRVTTTSTPDIPKSSNSALHSQAPQPVSSTSSSPSTKRRKIWGTDIASPSQFPPIPVSTDMPISLPDYDNDFDDSDKDDNNREGGHSSDLFSSQLPSLLNLERH